MNSPLVSVIIPIYQSELYLADCIGSVLGQDYPNFEILLVDDASTDRSPVIAADFARRDPRIQLISHAANRGCGPARNTGMARAAGAWLLFLDADDCLATPGAVTALVQAAGLSGRKVVTGSCEWLLADGSVVEFDRKYDRELGGKPGQSLAGLHAFLAAWGRASDGWLPIRPWGILIDRAFLTQIRLDFPPGEHQDLSFTPFLYYMSGGVL